jgi:integrative and conjugative element protein (TIGR02256 family)
MELLLPEAIAKKLHTALKVGGSQEIGGLLMGEHMAGDTFRVVDISVQTLQGTHSTFERDPDEHRAQLAEFFTRTGADYTRFNYLGEWHSHPSFEPLPSSKDMRTMRSIVSDPRVGVNFAVLIIVRLVHRDRLAMSATAVLPDGSAQAVSMKTEGAAVLAAPTLWHRIVRWLTNW